MLYHRSVLSLFFNINELKSNLVWFVPVVGKTLMRALVGYGKAFHYKWWGNIWLLDHVREGKMISCQSHILLKTRIMFCMVQNKNKSNCFNLWSDTFLNRNNILKRSNDTTGSALYETSLSAELLAWKAQWPLKNVAAIHSNWPLP